MIYILYIILSTGSNGGGVSVESREFKTQESCEFVATELRKINTYPNEVTAKCFGVKQ